MVLRSSQTISSLALLGLLIPFFGIGTVPAVIALVAYALLPLLRNIYTGIKEVDPSLYKQSAISVQHIKLSVYYFIKSFTLTSGW